MVTFVFFAVALAGLAYLAVVMFRVVNADTKGGISNVLTAGTLFKMSLSFMVLCLASGAIYLGGSASGISGGGGNADNRSMLDTASQISEFCLYASLALAVIALISYALKKNVL
ncbi:hypothetical protein K3169_19650 [Pseudomonas phytophila]|uniref:Uncharacterized protein n=1 Tax=Pseudomonas phytophila TaxID=2867264 RepID=A0ABY6F9M5_9PSED|nr:hypothetical protein [Pseudomonas phytophila]UXZ94570.1 hypothetical protein K3169_19650 [Pseudomonas phytophila]